MMTMDPVLDAAAHIDGGIALWERLRGESVCGDCEHCRRIFDESWFSNPGSLAVCSRHGLDWDERAVRWTDDPCDDFLPRGWLP